MQYRIEFTDAESIRVERDGKHLSTWSGWSGDPSTAEGWLSIVLCSRELARCAVADYLAQCVFDLGGMS